MGCVTEPRIVVGVDGSAGSIRALRWAADEARQEHGQLRVVLAWEPAYLATYSSVTAHADRSEQERAAQAALAKTLSATFAGDMPDDVVTIVIEGVAERVLATESCAADLLVLGSKPKTPRSPVGPVIRGCLHQARCPVIVIGQCKAPAGASGYAQSSVAGRHRVMERSLAEA
jgi:nucleotide-binding universal stress UspA family protein